MPSATLTSKGQMTIPKEVREHLGIRSGDRLDFIIHSDGSVRVKPATLRIAELRGVLHRKGIKPVSVKAMKTAVRRRAVLKHLRGRG